MKTVEAVIELNGEVRLVEAVHVLSPRRALVTILDEAPTVDDTARLSEAALAEDWNRAEEDAAWVHLQPGNLSILRSHGEIASSSGAASHNERVPISGLTLSRGGHQRGMRDRAITC